MITRRSNLQQLLAIGALPLIGMRRAAAAGSELLRVISSNSMSGLLEQLGPPFERRHQVRLQIQFDTSLMISRRIERGEAFDVAILTHADAVRLATKNVVTRVTDIARSGIGVAVRTGLPVPDVSTVPALETALRNAHSIAFSATGGSGLYTARLLERLGLAKGLESRIRRPTTPQMARMLEQGDLDLIIEQISEIRVMRAARYAGPLPPAVQFETILSACASTHTAHGDAACDLVTYLSDPRNASVIRDCWLDPP